MSMEPRNGHVKAYVGEETYEAVYENIILLEPVG